MILKKKIIGFKLSGINLIMACKLPNKLWVNGFFEAGSEN
jgi:hypothetical protein